MRTSKPFITWRHALAGVLIAIAIPATIVLYRYWHRPLFANHFVHSELDPLPDLVITPAGTSFFSVGDGQAKAMYESYWKGPNDFDAEVARLTGK